MAHGDSAALDFFTRNRLELLAVLGRHGVQVERALNDFDFKSALEGLVGAETER